MKDEFHIDVIFRRKTAYCRNVTGEEPIGTIMLTTKRCDVEAVLSEYNVKAYRIVWCSSPHQTMQDFCDIPAHYYEKEKAPQREQRQKIPQVHCTTKGDKSQ